MTDSVISVLRQTLQIVDVEEIVVTDPVFDDANSVWVRDVMVYSAPVTESSATLILTLRLVSETRDKINVTAPEQQF